MKITIIIPTYNTQALTEQCLESLASTIDLRNHEVLIIDDNSTDKTRDYLRGLPATFTVIYNDRNQGYARNCNVAARMASGDMICFCNSDLIFLPGWLSPMLEAWQTQKNVGIIGNLQRRTSDRRIDHLGVQFHADGRPYHLGAGYRYAPTSAIYSVSAVTAACCLTSRKLFLEFGGFCEDYINGFEDTDLCLRMSQAGYRHYVASQSEVLHHISSSPGRKSNEDRNMRVFLERWKEACEDIYAREHTHWRNFEKGLWLPRFLRFETYSSRSFDDSDKR